MAANIQLRPFQIADLAVIRDIGIDTLASLVDSLGQSTTCVRPHQLHRLLASADLNNDASEALMRQLLSLRGLMRRTGFTIDEVIDGLRTGLRPTVSEWSEKEFEKWKEIEPILAQLLDTKSLRMVSKASDLAYEYANLFQSARIVTDVRPIFDDSEGDTLTVDAAIVSFTLRLNFDSRDGDHGLSIALDEPDIRAIKEQCERALLKADMLSVLMRDMAKLPTFVVGGTDNEP